MSKIFISYRRDDTKFYAINLRKELAEQLGGEQIFMDIDNIEPGEDFVEVIQEKVGACDVLLAVIGKSWLSCIDKAGQRRLDSPDDFVRLEIEAALERKIRVIPVLVGGALVPADTDLPDSIKRLARRNAIALDDIRFREDVHRLLETIKKVITAKPPIDDVRVEPKVEPPPTTHTNPYPEPPTTTRADIPGLATITQPHGPAPAPADDSTGVRSATKPAAPSDFAIFRDHLKDGSEGPEMIRIPAGQFRMGDLSGKGNDVEKPVHTVRIARPFAIGRYAVTFDEYDVYAQATRRPLPDDQGWGRGRRPVIMVSWDDAVAFCQWLSEQTGKCYRLPSEAEWEYAARAATETEYWWGNDIGSNRANCDGSGSEWSNKQTAPVGSFQPNPWGLYDTAGNVCEWVQDVWHGHYEGAPTDGSAWEIAPPVNAVSTSSVFGLFKRTPAVPEPGRRVMRGGSWFNNPGGLRSATRLGDTPDFRLIALGFRLAQDL